MNKRSPQSLANGLDASNYDHLVDASSIVMVIDPEGNIAFLNKYASDFFGLTHFEAVGKPALGYILPSRGSSASQFNSMLSEIHSHPEKYRNIELKHSVKGVREKWVLWGNSPIKADGGSLGGVLCIGLDISDRKIEQDILKECCSNLETRLKGHMEQVRKANEDLRQEVNERRWVEDILRNSENKYRLVVENANEAIVIIQDGFIKYFNPKTVKVLNQPVEELTSRPVDDFLHPDDRYMAANRRLKMLKGESGPSVFSLRIIDQFGVLKWLEINTVLIEWMGRPATLSFFNNITERKLAEDEVRAYQGQLRSLASELALTEEKERRRLADDLHDHIGQTLALIKIKLGVLRDQSTTEVLEHVDHIRDLVDQTIRSTKSLTFQLSPPILYEMGLESTLEWLGEQVHNEHGIDYMFVDDGKEKPLDRDVSVLMFQAVRELVMNIVKHSDADKFSISTCKNNNTLQIVVEDNGRGFNPADVSSSSFGFFSVRERLNRFGGTIDIFSKPGLGTRIFLNAPIRIKSRREAPKVL